MQPPLALSAALIKYCYWIKRLHLSILLPSMGVDVRGSTDGGRDGRPTVARSSSSQSVCGEKGTLPSFPGFVRGTKRERKIPSPPLLLPFPDTIAPQIASDCLSLASLPWPRISTAPALWRPATDNAGSGGGGRGGFVDSNGRRPLFPLPPSFAPPSVRPSSFPLLPFSYTYLPTYSNSRAWKRRETTRLGL